MPLRPPAPAILQVVVITLAIAMLLAVLIGCSRPPDASNGQKLPFDRQPASSGISPTQLLVPSATRIPEGTSLTVRLTRPLSSTTARAGDSFEASLDEPVVVGGQTLLQHNATFNGRVLDAKRSAGPRNPGYLRITLTSVNDTGKTVLIDTSSIFTKATSREDRPANDRVAVDRPSPDRPSPNGGSAALANPGASNNDVVFTTDRRLTFRLAQPVDLP